MRRVLVVAAVAAAFAVPASVVVGSGSAGAPILFSITCTKLSGTFATTITIKKCSVPPGDANVQIGGGSGRRAGPQRWRLHLVDERHDHDHQLGQRVLARRSRRVQQVQHRRRLQRHGHRRDVHGDPCRGPLRRPNMSEQQDQQAEPREGEPGTRSSEGSPSVAAISLAAFLMGKRRQQTCGPRHPIARTRLRSDCYGLAHRGFHGHSRTPKRGRK